MGTVYIIVYGMHTIGTQYCNKSEISYTFAPKEMCRKHYIIEQISGSLHEIWLYNVHLIYIS